MSATKQLERPFGAFRYRPRRDYRSGPPTARDEAASAPWCCEPVKHSPLTIPIEPGRPVRFEGNELAELAGLPTGAPAKGFPAVGELAGLVVLSNVQAMATVSMGMYPYTKLRAHQLTSVLLHAGCALEVVALSLRGTVQVWACRAVKAPALAPAGQLDVYPAGAAGDVLRAAAETLDKGW